MWSSSGLFPNVAFSGHNLVSCNSRHGITEGVNQNDKGGSVQTQIYADASNDAGRYLSSGRESRDRSNGRSK